VRVPADPPIGGIGELDELEDLADPSARDPGGPSQHAQVVASRPARVEAGGVEYRSDRATRGTKVGVPRPVDPRVAGVGPGEAEQDPERRGLAGAVRAEEPGDRPRWSRERHAVHGSRRPEDLRHLGDLDQEPHRLR
jgi:hypothetical protein